MPHQIKCPIPGTFFRKPSPDEPPYREVGGTVVKGDTIALVEVMKTFHEIKADADGTIAAFPVDDGDPVTAGMIIAELE